MTPSPRHPAPVDSGWPRLLLLCGMIVLAVASRCLPHPWNFTPLGAVALFSGATLSSRWLSIFVPLVAIFAGDLLIGMHWLMPAVYACLLFNVWLGRRLDGRRGPLAVGGSAMVGAIVFFIVTNFASWVLFYEHTLAGLASCYTLAIPYFGQTLGGDLFFSAVLFGSLALIESRVPQLRSVADPVSQ